MDSLKKINGFMLSPIGSNASGDFGLPYPYYFIRFIKKGASVGYINTGIVLDTDDFVIDFMTKPGINSVNDIWPIVSIYENGTVSGIHIDSNKKICATIFGLTLTSNVVISQWSYYTVYHIRLTCKNGQATLYVSNFSQGTQEDTVTGSYVFSPYSTALGIFGDVEGNYSTYTTSELSYVKIIKADTVNMLIGAKNSNTNNYGLYNINTETFITGSVSFTSGDASESVGYGAFAGNKLIESVDLNNSYCLSSILSFANCTNLTSVTNFGYVETVNFYNCDGLINIPALPNSVTRCDFSYCNNIPTIIDCNDLPPNLTWLCFRDTNLTDISNLPNSITSLSYSFAGSDLVNIDSLPNNVNNLRYTFMNCTNLVNAPEIPNSVTSMYYTFTGCTNLVNAPVIPDSVTNMTYAFSGCSSLVCIPSLSNNITDLSSTFTLCKSLVDAPVIPNGVTNMQSAFGSCSNLVNAPVIPNSVTNLYDTFGDCTNLVDAPAIPNSVIDMERTFEGCTNLINAPTIPNSVTGLYFTFSQTNIASIPVIANSVTNIDYAFHVCPNLTNVSNIPDSVTSMTHAFSDCYNLTTVSDIPSSVTNMTTTFWNSANLVGTMNIHSANVTAADLCFFIYDAPRPSTLTVHVPANSTTYNTFVAAGYNDQGTKDGVILLADL